jgi:hypothetical protein
MCHGKKIGMAGPDTAYCEEIITLEANEVAKTSEAHRTREGH